MPFNGSNTFTIVNTFVPATTILSSAVNTNFSDIATGLSDCATRDAQAAITGNMTFSSTGYLKMPVGTTGQRPASPSQGMVRFNSTTVNLETYDGTAWDSLFSSIVMPQGYLTLTSGTPVIASDVTAATAVYYTPYTGQLCPIFNGSAFVNQTFAEQTLTLSASQSASTIYDVFAFLNNGTFTIGTGPAWSSSAAGSGSRGTGAGTTQLQRLNGVLTNAQNSLTMTNGGSTYTVSTNQGTYLGSIFIDGSAGQVSCHRSFGQSRKWGVWNCYNRVPVILQAGDSTASWTYGTANTIRASNNAAANSLTIFSGLAEEEYQLTFNQNVVNGASGNVTATVGIGFNSTSAFSGTQGAQIFTTNGLGCTIYAQYDAAPSIGINTITSLEEVNQTHNVTFNGTQASMLLRGVWRA